MLKARIITAVILLIVLSAILWVDSPWPFLLFISLVVGLAAFEWLRLVYARLFGVACALGIMLALLTVWQAYVWIGAAQPDRFTADVSIALTGLVWVLLVPAYLALANVQRSKPVMGWGLFAPICLFATWAAIVIVWLDHGVWQMLSLLALVWVADIFAYFGGRQWGKVKLAPTISPGKTREGALIGLAGVVAWMLATAFIDDSYAHTVWIQWGWWGVVASAILLGCLAVMGDLFESLLKRQANVKDSGGLLPGHGGVYDRIDAVVAVVPVAYLITHDFWDR